MIALLLALAVDPQARELPELPSLPAPLAWLEDRDDHPLVGRRLMLLDPGVESPRVLLEPLLWSFDAADRQAVAWLGDDVVVTGPVRSTRSAPNVGMEVHLVPTDGAPRVTVPGVLADRVHPAADGGVLATSGGQGMRAAVFAEDGVEVRALFPAAPGHRLRTAAWNAAGDALFVSLAGGRGELEAGLWRVPFDAGQARFGDAVRAGAGPAWPVVELGDGSWLATAHVAREKYTPHEIRRIWPGSDRSEVLARDLHWNRALALAARDGEPAYVRFEDGALVHDGRVLWRGPKAADSVSWSPDGRWLAFEARDEDRAPWVWALEFESGTVHRLGRGLRPAWGPLAARPRVESIGEVALWSIAVGADDTPAGLPAFVRATEETLTCRRAGGETRILFLPFERAGDEAAYGIYALGGVKDDVPVPHPLRGAPVTWPDRDHAQALAHALTLAGVGGERARDVVAARGAEWFAEGLRVFFVLPLPLEPHLAHVPVDPACRALVVRVDVRR